MRILAIVLVALLAGSCGVTDNQTKVSKWIKGEKDQENIKLQLVRLTDKLAPGAGFDNRDSAIFDGYYQERSGIHELASYYIDDTVCFFQLYRKVPGLFNEKIAIGGYFKTNPLGKIAIIKEVYITPKLRPEELKKKTTELFLDLVNNGNVQSHLADKSFIMFPDSVNIYSVKDQRWVYQPIGTKKI